MSDLNNKTNKDDKSEIRETENTQANVEKKADTSIHKPEELEVEKEQIKKEGFKDLVSSKLGHLLKRNKENKLVLSLNRLEFFRHSQ